MENEISYEAFDAQVDSFLRHQMTAEEEAAFKSELDAEPEKKERARVIALMIQSMQKGGREQDQKIVDQIKDMTEAQFRQTIGLKPKVISFWPRIVKYAAAACIACILCWGGAHYYGLHQTTSLGASQYMAYVSDISEIEYVRGTTDAETISKLNALFDNVKANKEIESTIMELEPLYLEASSEDSSYYDFQDDIAWNLAIAYLLDGDREKPIPLLEGMVERNQDYPQIAQPAQNLINQIKAL